MPPDPSAGRRAGPLRSLLNRRLGSLGVQFGLLLAAVSVPLALALLFQFRFTAETVEAQVAETQQSYLRLYQTSIDRILASGALALEAVSRRGPPAAEALEAEAALHDQLSGFFVYDPAGGRFWSGHLSYVDDRELAAVRAWAAESSGDTGLWRTADLDGTPGLMYRLSSGGLVWGAWVDADRFLQPLYLIDSGQDSRSFFLVGGRRPFPATDFPARHRIDLTTAEPGTVVGRAEPYLFVATPSASGNFDLAVLLPEARYLRALPPFLAANVAVALTTLAAIVVLLLLFRRMILRPLSLLTSAMGVVDGEDLESRLEFRARSHEIARIRDSFNAMVERIHTLKINVYEERLHTQQEELHFLQLQLNPHFFLNSLNILYQLAEVPNLPLLQDLIVRLSRYFRYMHNGGAAFLPVKAELDHARNYFEMQQVRFPGRLFLEVVQEGVPDDLPVPPLVVHTFLENSIKYGLRKDRPLWLGLTLRRSGAEVVLTAADDGPGFPEAVLGQLAREEKLVDQEREHIGITNVRRRMAILYGTKASLRCFNRPEGGAAVEIRLPVPRSMM